MNDEEIKARAARHNAESKRRSRERRAATCVHFNGIQTKCGVGRDPMEHRALPPVGMARFACLPCNHTEECKPTCPEFRAPTEAELDAEDAKIEQALARISKNRSSCCDAPIDDSRTTKHRGQQHGPHFCSKCKKLVFWV